jgi:hypothetical protein
MHFLPYICGVVSPLKPSLMATAQSRKLVIVHAFLADVLEDGNLFGLQTIVEDEPTLFVNAMQKLGYRATPQGRESVLDAYARIASEIIEISNL